MRWLVVFALAAACGGCASITRGTTEQVQIQSEPAGAEVHTSMAQVCTTPCTLQFNRKDEFVVTASKPGYHSAQMSVGTRIAAGGAAGFAGNVLVVSANILYLVIGSWIIFGVKTGVWGAGFLFSSLCTIFIFSVLLAVIVLIGVLLDSSAVAIMVTFALI